jgi:hypothetical protein
MAVTNEGIQEDVKSGPRRDALQVFVESTGENDAPKVFAGGKALAVALEPVEQGGVWDGMGRAKDEPQGPRDGQTVPPVEAAKRKQGRKKMKGSGQGRSAKVRGSAGSRKSNGVVEAQMMRYAGATKEVEQIGAAAEQDVLAIVNGVALAGGDKGRSASAQRGAALD